MIKSFFKKLFGKIRLQLNSVSKKSLALILVIALALASPVTVYKYIKISHTNYITLTLNYSNARRGLTPTGGRFNVAELKSDEVLQEALNYLGDDSLSIEDVKDRITIDAKVPQSSVDKVKSAVANDNTYTYCPSEFLIYYNQGNKLERNKTGAFLYALSKAYTEYFAENYAEKNTILDYDIEDELAKYDYGEQCQIMIDKVTAMIKYLEKYSSESNTYRSPSTGYSFNNLSSMLLNIRDVNLEKLNAYIVQNGISKDKPSFIRKQAYSIEKKTLLYNIQHQGSDIAKDTMDIYNAHITGVAFIPSYDDNKEYYMGRTKTGLDIIVNNSYSDGLKAAELSKQIDYFEYLIYKYSVAPQTKEEAMQNAQQMIEEISDYISKVSVLAIQTDNDYIQSVSNNYITVIFHPISRMSYVIMFIKMIAFFFILVVAIVIIRKWAEKRFYGKIERVLNKLTKRLKLDEGIKNEN